MQIGETFRGSMDNHLLLSLFLLRLTWDRSISVLERTLVQRDADTNRTVTILRCGTKPVGPISARDFYDATVSMVSSFYALNMGALFSVDY